MTLLAHQVTNNDGCRVQEEIARPLVTHTVAYCTCTCKTITASMLVLVSAEAPTHRTCISVQGSGIRCCLCALPLRLCRRTDLAADLALNR